MRPSKPTRFDLVWNAIFMALLPLCVYQAWQSGSYLTLVGLVALGLLAGWALVSDLRRGTRPPTHFEQFEYRRNIHALLTLLASTILLIIGALLIGSASWANPFKFVLIVGLSFSYVMVVWRDLRQIRGRGESVGAYKQRTGYQEPPNELDH